METIISVELEKVASIIATSYRYNKSGHDGVIYAYHMLFGEELFNKIADRAEELYSERYERKEATV